MANRHVITFDSVPKSERRRKLDANRAIYQAYLQYSQTLELWLCIFHDLDSCRIRFGHRSFCEMTIEQPQASRA